jgi:CheY-like chemotaxis protein
MIPTREKLHVILIIEDEFARGLLEVAAEESGMFGLIRAAENRHEALALIWDSIEEHERPDVIIADLCTDGCNSVQLARDLRTYDDTRGVLVALVTDGANGGEQSIAEAAGADYVGNYSASITDMAAMMQEIARRAISSPSVALH